MSLPYQPLGDADTGLRSVPAPRTLTEVASTIAGVPCQVSYAVNALDPASVVAKDSVIVLHPDRATLGDFLLAAAAMRFRTRIEASTGRLQFGTRRRLLAAAREFVDQNLPGARALGANMRAAKVRLAWDRLPQRSIDANDLRSGGRVAMSRRSYSVQANSGLEAILEAARLGHFPRYRLPAFPELDVVRHSLPMEREPVTAADRVALEEWHKLHTEVVADAVRCFRDSAQILDDTWAYSTRVAEGSQLADDALHDAYVASRCGTDLPVFVDEQTEPVVQWDPERYVVTFGFDMAGQDGGRMLDPVPSRSLLCVFLRAFQVLGVPVRIVGFWDHAVPMPDGRTRYLLIDMMIKDFDEPFDDAAALRVTHALQRDRFKSASSVANAALHHEILCRGLVEEVQQREAMVAQIYGAPDVRVGVAAG